MIIVAVEGIKKRFGPEPLLDGVTFEVRPGQRIGLLGPNGSGKTTLLRILAGRDEPDAGARRLHPSIRVGYLEQQPLFQQGRTLWEEARSALDELLALQQSAIQVAEALGRTSDAAEHRRLAARYDHLQQELQRREAYNLDHKIERVLDGLGFGRPTFSQPVESLSGGEQNRLMLAKLLLAHPDLMLLDEPSNHLDIAATEWLEEILAGSPAAMILVSHDRCFLDKVTNRTLELFQGTVDSYAGNCSAYWQQKEQRLLLERRTYQKQQLQIAKAEDFIRRNAYGQKHAQAEDRRKKLARIELVQAPREIVAPPMAFPAAARSGDIVLRVEDLAKGYGRPLFENLSFDILRGQRWALLGPNGSGKTTLLRCLLGLVQPDAGRVVVGQGVEVGYFDQQLAGLDDDLPLVDAVRPPQIDSLQQQRRDLLARFGLGGDTALQEVGCLSGGERCRAALARLAAAEANFLVLDEPTNHLDLWARGALQRAVSAFQGTVLLVSHDRYFIDHIADHLLVIEPDRVRALEGNYQTYLDLVGRGPAETPRDTAKGQAKAKSVKPAVPAAAKPSPSKRRFPYRKIADLETEIFQREARLEDLHAALAQPDTRRSGDRVRQLKAEIAQEKEALKTLYEHWEEATELNW